MIVNSLSTNNLHKILSGFIKKNDKIMNESLSVYKTLVQPDWIDFNDHMTEGFYGVPFGLAARKFLFNIGLK